MVTSVRNFDARIPTKNHWFWRAFSRNYFPRVHFFALAFMLHIRPKIIDFLHAFWCNYLRRVDKSTTHVELQVLDEKSSILACFLMHLASACSRSDKQADKSFACFLPSILACFLMQLPSACRFSLFNFWSNFDEKLSISSCFLMQLPSPWWFFDVWTFCQLKKSAPSACGTLT